MWAPDAFTAELQEPYTDSPGGQRVVQYFDKARMEITQPAADPNSIWYVTNGLLVVELISGNMQLGATTFAQRSPAQVNVAGDADDPSGPTYATFGTLLGTPPAAMGTTLSQRLYRSGQVADDPSLAGHAQTVALVDDVTNHAIAAPFWSFMTSSGTTWDGAAYVTAPLFENAYFATGRPITEAYWANVKVAGVYQDVLLQCFERRCLTYNPANAPEWRVEAGNVGRHYHTWRYAQPGGSATPTTTATPSATVSPTPDTATEYESDVNWGGEFVPGATFWDPHEIVIDAQGHLWLADTNNHRIIEFDANGVQLRAIGSEGKGPLQFIRPTDVAFDADGNIYVVEFDGHRIQKISADGAFIKTWGSLGSALGQFDRPAALAISGDTLYVSDFRNHRIQMFDLDGTFRGYWGSLGTGNYQFQEPAGIAIDPSGNVFVADSVNNRILKFDATGNYLSQFGSSGALPGEFAGPWGIDIASDGAIYVVEENNKRVQVFAPNGEFVRQWGADGSGPGQFRAPQGVAVDGAGAVFVVERRDGRVQKFNAEGEYLYEFRDGRRGRFGLLAGIEFDEQGRVLVPDPLSGYARVQIYTNDGIPLSDISPIGNEPGVLTAPIDVAIGPNGDRYVLDGTVVKRYNANWEYVGTWASELISPQAIATDADGNVYIVNTGNNHINKSNASGALLQSWGTPGAGAGQFDMPSGIVVVGERVYVTDTNNARVQVFDRQGEFVGQWGTYGTGEGEFDRPIGIAADRDGYLYIVDHGNGRIQKFDGSGRFIAAWGTPGGEPGQFNAPWGISVDARGYVAVTEPGGYRVQIFRPVD
jgi:DNA-binding beta-propeller fold protein YncE